MRVSMSAIGSVMLIFHLTCIRLPARLDDAGDLTTHRELAELVARKSELAEIAARAAGQRAPVAQPGRVGVARQLLDLEPCREAHLFGRLGVVQDRLELLALLRELLHELAALLVAVDQGELRHG